MIKEKLEVIYKTGLSDAQIAERIGVNQSTVYRMRIGESGDKTSKMLGLLDIEYRKARRRKVVR